MSGSSGINPKSHQIASFLSKAELPSPTRRSAMVDRCHSDIKPSAMEIARLLAIGIADVDIAVRTNLPIKYVSGVTSILKKGEERLFDAIVRGHLSVSIATKIMKLKKDQVAVLEILACAHKTGALRGTQYTRAQIVIKKRAQLGISRTVEYWTRVNRDQTPPIMRCFQRELDRQNQVIEKARFASTRLLEIASEFNLLASDANFLNLLRAEGFESMPTPLASLLEKRTTRNGTTE